MPNVLPPYLVTPLPRCAIILERHTHKNGGSTFRSIINTNDMRDGWTYWGYGLHQHAMITSKVTSALLGPRNESCSFHRAAGRRALSAAAAPPPRPPFRLVAEHHYSRVPLVAALGYFGPLSPMQQAASSCGCRVVLVTRLREPLAFYVSFYRWTVFWRQRRNASAFGGSMLEWAPRNLQSSMFLRPLDATWAEFVGVHTSEGRWRRKVYSQFDDPAAALPGAPSPEPGAPPAGVGARRRAELRRMVRSFDLVGLVERFDETLLMLADLTGLQRLLYQREVPASTNHHWPQPTKAEVCPDAAACVAGVRAVAPLDHELYDEFRAAFDARVAQLGAPFAARLAAFRAANAAHQVRTARPHPHS